ncbi:hypothetical protein HZS_7826, partial [Henneguya salminicola]
MPGSATLFSKIEKYYEMCQRFFLNIQDPNTGLFPSSLHKGSTRPDASSNFAWIRDNVYCVLCIWGLAISYKKISDIYDVGHRTYELEKSAVKVMRSLLYCMMKQVTNCEQAVGSEEWGHLQIDAISLYLLILAEIIGTGNNRLGYEGINVIYTLDEVAFVQNLIFYIENAYTIPDYGIFERGDKTNHGQPELNVSSIGMAKPDNIYMCRTVVESMLPKESLSKVLRYILCLGSRGVSFISYKLPRFCIGKLFHHKNYEGIDYIKTRGIWWIIDGRVSMDCVDFCGMNQDPTRLHYEVSELKIFENIECEWPLFFIYLVLDGIFLSNRTQSTEYMKKLKKIMIISEDGFEMVPELYYVPLVNVHSEYNKPKSQMRMPSIHVPHLWSQSLYILANLLYDDILTPADIDPLNRRLLKFPGPELVVQIMLVSQDDETYNLLTSNNFKVHHSTGEQILSVFPAYFLNEIYEKLGECKKLRLTGRPARDIGTVSTSVLYRTQDKFYAFNPQFMETTHFYFTFDYRLLEDNFKNEMNYIRTHWTLEGRPTMVLSVSSRLLQNSMDSIIGQFIQKLSSGHYLGIRVQLGVLGDFLATSCIATWDFLSTDQINGMLNDMCLIAKKRGAKLSSVFQRSLSKLDSSNGIEHEDTTKFSYLLRQTIHLTSRFSPSISHDDTSAREKLFVISPEKIYKSPSTGYLSDTTNTQQFLEILGNTDDLFQQALCLFGLYRLETLTYEVILNNGINYGTINNLLRELYNLAGSHKLWFLLRHTSGYLRKRADGLSQAANNFLIRQKQFTVGYPSFKETVISSQLTAEELNDCIYDTYQEDLTSAVLTQEVMIYLSMLIRTEPNLFDQMIRLRLGLIIEVAASEFSRETQIPQEKCSDIFLNLSPFFMKTLIYHILCGKEFKIIKHKDEYNIVSDHSRLSKIKAHLGTENSLDTTENEVSSDSETFVVKDKIGFWYRRRFLDGSLNRVPDTFFSDVWRILDNV